MLLRIISPLFFTFLSFNITAQSISPDTVYLVDGTFLTGEILNPGSENSIQLKNNDGAIIYIKNQRIDKLIIKPNRLVASPKSEVEDKYQNNPPSRISDAELRFRNNLLALEIILGQPIGDFGSSSSAGAKANVGFGVRYMKKIDPALYWSLNFNFIRYGFDTDILIPSIIQQTGFSPLSFSRAYWESFSFGGGLHWFQPINKDFELSLTGSINYQFMKIPQIDILFNGGVGFFESKRGNGISPDLAVTTFYKERLYFKLNLSVAKIGFGGNSGSAQGAFVQNVIALGFGVGVLVPKLKSRK